MLKIAFTASLLLALGATGCSTEPVQSKHRSGGCPEGTKLIEGRYCVLADRPFCPEGFAYDESLRACYFLCPDASVEPDAEPSPFCPDEAGTNDEAP